MHRFQGFGIFFVEVDAGDAGVVHLLEEFLQVRPPLMIHPCTGKQTAFVSSLKNPDTKIDILSKTHLGKTSQCLIYLPSHPHIKTTRIEFIHFLFSATNTSRCEKRSHGIINRFLDIRKGIVCAVGTSESIGRRSEKFRLDGIEISLGENHIRIQYNKVFTLAAFRSVVTCLPRS